MIKKQIPYVKTDTVFDTFNQHLRDDMNERILFSAPFGAGKSTFLKDFFNEHTEYITLKLYPVNYSIAPNQDVFELIKYDLLYELLNNYSEDITLEKDEFSMLLMTQMFILHKMKLELPLKLLFKAASVVSGGKIDANEPIDLIAEGFKKFADYKGEVDTNEYSLLTNYIKSFRTKVGHAHESDDITELIINMIDEVKNAKSKSDAEVTYKTVLLIDDLDRLDPEHIFRLFNIFSAHYDDVTDTNKFGFDKIVFVCDINNISQMFHHKYGLSVDFTGYVDKYYSSEIFRFNIHDYLKESLRSLILSRYDPLKFYPDKRIAQSFLENYNLNSIDGFYSPIKYILEDMIDLNIVRIRNFQRFKYFALPNQKMVTKFGESYTIFYPLAVLLINLERLFPRPSDLLKAFELIYQNFPSNYEVLKPNERGDYKSDIEKIIQYSILFIIDPRLVFGRGYDTDGQYTVPFINENDDKIYMVFNIGRRSFDASYTYINYVKCTLSNTLIDGINNNPAINKPNPYWFLYNAYKNCIAEKYF